jgi:putative hydrolase of HD superfamily
MKNFNKILEFQKILKKFNSIYRDVGSLHKAGDLDNDVEHSYRVAMLCWMLIDEYKLKYDVNKVIRYALVHDLVEVYAGDASIYSNYSQKDKEKKEHNSFLKLKKEFPKLKSIWSNILDYEKRKDEESKFVYLIEKLEPVLVVLLSEKDHWIKRKVTFEDFIDRKQRKIKDIDMFSQVFNHEIMSHLHKNKNKLFNR